MNCSGATRRELALIAGLLALISAPWLGHRALDGLLRAALERFAARTALHLAWADYGLVGSSEGLALHVVAPRLSRADGTEVLAARHVRLVARWGALWSGALAFDHLSIDGLRLLLERNAEGRFDLAALFADSGGGQALSLGTLILSDARIDWQDAGRAGQLAIGELYAGPLHRASNGRIRLAGLCGQGEARSSAWSAPLAWRLEFVDLHAAPALVSVERLKLTLRAQPDAVLTELTFAQGAADRQNLWIESLHLAGHYRSPERQLRAALSARLHGRGAQWRLESLTGHVALDDPRLPEPLPIAGWLSLDAPRQRMHGALRSRYRGAALDGRFEVRWPPPHLRIALEIEHFDLDHWRSTTAPARPSMPHGLAALTVDGRLHIGRLRVAGSEAEQVRLQLQGRPGRWLLRQPGGE